MVQTRTCGVTTLFVLVSRWQQNRRDTRPSEQFRCKLIAIQEPAEATVDEHQQQINRCLAP